MDGKDVSKLENELESVEMEQTIELDCPPGKHKPDYYLSKVLEGTGIKPVNPSSTLFGNWIFKFSHVPEEEWKKHEPTFESRIKALYQNGEIRYGSW